MQAPTMSPSVSESPFTDRAAITATYFLCSSYQRLEAVVTVSKWPFLTMRLVLKGLSLVA